MSAIRPLRTLALVILVVAIAGCAKPQPTTTTQTTTSDTTTQKQLVSGQLGQALFTNPNEAQVGLVTVNGHSFLQVAPDPLIAVNTKQGVKWQCDYEFKVEFKSGGTDLPQIECKALGTRWECGTKGVFNVALNGKSRHEKYTVTVTRPPAGTNPPQPSLDPEVQIEPAP